MDINTFKLDEKKQSEGIWFPTSLNGVRVKVRPFNNPDYRNLQNKLLRELPDEAREGLGYKVTTLEYLQAQCLLDTVLLDWEGLTEKGKPLPYSREAAERLLLDPSFILFRTQVITASEKASGAVIGITEADEKN